MNILWFAVIVTTIVLAVFIKHVAHQKKAVTYVGTIRTEREFYDLVPFNFVEDKYSRYVQTSKTPKEGRPEDSEKYEDFDHFLRFRYVQDNTVRTKEVLAEQTTISHNSTQKPQLVVDRSFREFDDHVMHSPVNEELPLHYTFIIP